MREREGRGGKERERQRERERASGRQIEEVIVPSQLALSGMKFELQSANVTCLCDSLIWSKC